jgi:UDP-N-acetylmuramoyl-L-alanyl-D-glutamate--2,6-diaminopimelate ligase
MRGSKIDILARISTSMRAKAAAWRYGRPSHKMRVVLVVGQDGAAGTVAFLASILRSAGERVGICTQQYVQIADERVSGSDQADIQGDPFRLQSLLAQMRRAKCGYALIEVPADLPAHQFTGIRPTMLIIRRCGDDYTNQMTVTARLAMLNRMLALRPQFVVYNGDDPCSSDLSHLAGHDSVINFGTHPKAECRITQVRLRQQGSAFTLVADHNTELPLTTKLTGKQSIYNATAAAAAGYVMRVPIEAIEKGVANMQPLAGHLEYLAIERPYQIILDAAITPGGLAETLETVRHFAKNRLIVVLGATLGMAQYWLPLLGEIAADGADRLIVTDGEFAPQQSAAHVREQIMQAALSKGEAKVEEVPHRKAALEKAISIARRDDLVLVAGTTLRPYRQLGDERATWSDRTTIEHLFEA